MTEETSDQEKEYPEDIDRALNILDDVIDIGETIGFHGALLVRSDFRPAYVVWIDEEPIDVIYPNRWPSAHQLSKYVEHLCAIHEHKDTGIDPNDGVMFG